MERHVEPPPPSIHDVEWMNVWAHRLKNFGMVLAALSWLGMFLGIISFIGTVVSVALALASLLSSITSLVMLETYHKKCRLIRQQRKLLGYLVWE